MCLKISIACALILSCGPSWALVNLEDIAQDFVLDVKQILIPEYPHAFNPSIVRWKGSLLLSFRIIPDPKQSFNSWLGLIWLDENFDPCTIPQLLETRVPDSSVPSRAEDGRLIVVSDRLYIVYSDNEDPVISKGGFRVYVAELDCDGTKFYIKHTRRIQSIERLSVFEGNDLSRREKNWVPFEYYQNLLLAYSITPHFILRPLFGTGYSETIASSENKVPWAWGELRGGTPALLDDYGDDDEYLAFFHSVERMATVHSYGRAILHYFMGAYTFSRKMPFRITKISPEPIVGKGFYSGAEYKPYWHPVSVVFPGGFISDKKYIWIAYGRQDHEVWMVKLDRTALYATLQPV